MKKIIAIFLILGVMIIIPKTAHADTHYTNFEELNFTTGKLIDEYSETELASYYKKVKKSKFSGWKTEVINKRAKVSFVSETMFSYYNDGYTSIDYKYETILTTKSKYSFSATGSISVNSGKNKTGFKSGLDASLKLSYSTDKEEEKKEKYEVKLSVDPGTKVDLYTYGEGRITNGVAAKYLFWVRTKLGGYEIFEITTQYQRLEKVKI